MFRKPPWCPLSSGESFSGSRFQGRAFFYRLGSGPEIARYFGLPPVRVGLLVDALGSEAPSELLAMDPGSSFSPCLSVLPWFFLGLLGSSTSAFAHRLCDPRIGWITR